MKRIACFTESRRVTGKTGAVLNSDAVERDAERGESGSVPRFVVGGALGVTHARPPAR